MNTEFLTRSLMFVPAHNDRLMQSASRSNADILLLDIEDSVQPVENKGWLFQKPCVVSTYQRS